MRQHIIALCLLLCGPALRAQVKCKTKDMAGTWQMTYLITSGDTVSLASEAAVKNFLFKQLAGKKERDSAMDVSTDSAFINMAAMVLGQVGESTLLLHANKTYRFTLMTGTDPIIETGNWAFNETTQSIRVTQIKKGKPAKSSIVTILPQGGQLFMQMEKIKGKGFLLDRKK
jgi:hypothetical protein